MRVIGSIVACVFLAAAIEFKPLNAREPSGLEFSERPARAHDLLARVSIAPAREQVPLGRPPSKPRQDPAKTNISYAEAMSVLESLREDLLPIELRAKTSAERESAWPAWVSRHDADIRARLVRGDEDSVVNFLFFGTTFTRQPRVIVARVVSEREHYDTIRDSATRNERIANVAERSTLFHDRGLSSDASLFVNFGIEQALEAIKSQAIFAAGEVRRVAIVGPGLDFTDKRDGYDFYPPQTIQPFAVVDALVRLGLTLPAEVQIATLDLSARINQHLEEARKRSRAGRGYTVQLPRDTTQRWHPNLVKYWERFGDRIGTTAKAVAAPAETGNLKVRAIRVRPALLSSTIPWEMNVVLQRLQSQEAAGLFDLIVATNVLVYYDAFEQLLALANVAKMLRPGGLFLSNELVFELPAIPMNLLAFTDVVYTDLGNGDRFAWYQRHDGRRNTIVR